ERLAQSAHDDVHQKQVDKLRADIAALAKAKPPQGRYFSLETISIEKTMPDSNEVASQIAAFNQTLCSLTQTSETTCPAPAKDAPTFVGSKTCQSCHEAEYTQWNTTRHAHALATLDRTGQRCDLGCI